MIGGLARGVKKISSILAKTSVGLLSSFFPRDDDLWVFGASGRDVFWESPKYFYLYVSDEKDGSGVRPVWISKSRDMVEELRDNGYEAFYYRSLKGLWVSLRCGKVFFSHTVEDVNAGLPLGAEKVNFFHGVPLKRFGWDNPSEIGGNGFATVLKSLYQVLYYDYDIGISSTSYMENVLKSSTAMTFGKIESTGFPRNDIFFRDVDGWEIGADVDAVERMRGSEKRMVMYLPTWRRYEDYSFEEIMDLDRMDSWAEKTGSVVIFKLHPSSEIDEEAVRGYDNLWLMQQSVDLQPLLKECDLLISDYSSVHNDFLLLDRPVVFYPFDLNRYRENRGFVRDYDNFTPGPKAYDFDELLERLDEVIEKDEYQRERKEILEKYFDEQDGGSAERLWNVLRDDKN